MLYAHCKSTHNSNLIAVWGFLHTYHTVQSYASSQHRINDHARSCDLSKNYGAQLLSLVSLVCFCLLQTYRPNYYLAGSCCSRPANKHCMVLDWTRILGCMDGSTESEPMIGPQDSDHHFEKCVYTSRHRCLVGTSAEHTLRTRYVRPGISYSR